MSQFHIPDELKEALQEGNLIPFVGAGVSMSVLEKGAISSTDSLFPSWGALLRDGAEGLDDTKKAYINATLNLNEADSYLEAAKKLKQYLGNQKWNVFLKEQLDFKKDDCQPSSLVTPKNIWSLNCPLIITTNYDKVLDWACPQEKLVDLQHWDIQATFEQADSLRRDITNPTVWHLHGRIANVNDIILTPGGYDNLYSNNESRYQTALTTLQTKLSTNPFLFIGFSFNDEVFVNQLKKINGIFDGNNAEHFVLIKKSQEQTIKKLDLNLTTITYEQHADLPKLLQSIASIDDVKLDEKSVNFLQNEEPVDRVFNPNNAIFNVPFRQKGSGVVGRESVLLELRALLLNGAQTNIGHAASFRGMGGLGKTQLAVEYAYRYKEHYSNGVIWLSADQDISNQLITIAKKAKWFSPHLEAVEILEKTIWKLKNTNEFLIIFDNVENYEQIESYLPTTEVTPHLLLTSRIDINGFKVLPLALLTEVEAIELLLKEADKEIECLSDEDNKICQKIVDTLGCLPLAIELAGSYLQKRRTISFLQYQELLEKSLTETLNHQHLASFTNNQKGLLATLTLTEQEIEQAPLIKDVLRLLSWSSSASMGVSLMATLLHVEEVELIEPLALGVELRLLASTEDNRYNIHRLLKEIQKKLYPTSSHEQWPQQVCQTMVTWFTAKKDEFSQLHTFQVELDHLEAWAELSEHYNWPYTAALFWLQAYPLWYLAQYKQAEILLNKAFQLITIKCDGELNAHILGDLGVIFGYLHKYEQALEYQEKALKIRQEVLGENHPDTATSYDNVGNTYSRLEKHDKALEYQKNSLNIRQEMLGETHPDTSISYNNISSTYSCLEKHNKAQEYQEKALKIQQEALGESHPHTATSYNNLGSTYRQLQQYEKSLEYNEKALKIRKEVLGEKHPNTATSYNNVGSIYGDLQQHEQALEYQEKALKTWQEVFGEQHPDTATGYNNIGALYGDLQQHDKALAYQEKALKVRQNVLSENHTDTATSFNCVGGTYDDLQQYDKALAYQEKALKIRKNILGESHADTCTSYNDVGVTYYKMRKYNQAIDHLKSAIAINLLDLHNVSISRVTKTINSLIRACILSNKFELAHSEIHQLRKHLALKADIIQLLDNLSLFVDKQAKKKGFRAKSNTVATNKRKKRPKKR
jgi:tetratricopeptide (TPR) repeat protein